MSPKQPDKEAIAAMVAIERIALADLLDQLEPDEWSSPSLCSDWTVREVVAHLTLATDETIGGMIVGMIKARGNFDRMNTDAAIDRARELTPSELNQRLRDVATSSKKNPMSTPADQLIDILVHTQDVTRPLERSAAMNPDRARPALDHAIDSRWYGAKKRFADVHLTATDADWTGGGGGLEVRGAIGDLLLVATGRNSVLGELSGPGVEELARQFAST